MASVLDIFSSVQLSIRRRLYGLPFFYGCTNRYTDTTIENVRFVSDNGGDGALIAVPPYTCPPENDAERYFLDVADSTDLPLGTYNNAPRLRTDLQLETLLRIFRHPNYIVHKESTACVNQFAALLRAAPDVSIMCDNSPEPGLAVQTMALGGQGISNGAGNIERGLKIVRRLSLDKRYG